jgi:hypothetical protein
MHERTRRVAARSREISRSAVATSRIIAEKLKHGPDYFADSIFEKIDPPLILSTMLHRERWMMDEANIREDEEHLSYSPSEGDHYDGWEFKWDGDTSEWLNAQLGNPDRARKQLRTREKFRDKNTGYMANKFRVSENNTGKSSYSWPESTFYNTPDQSSYTQPSLMGWAVKETYTAFREQGRYDEAAELLEEIYGTATEGNFTGLRGECAYFLNHRRTSPDNPLIFKVHPNETGRDYDSSLGFSGVDIIPGKSKRVTALKTAARWARMQHFGYRMGQKGRDPHGQRADWIPEQARSLYAVNDVMFNVLFVRNLHDTAAVAKELATLNALTNPAKSTEYLEQADFYEAQAKELEQAILSRMWHEKTNNKQRTDKQDTFFYNLDVRRKEKQINVKSITGLYPLLLESITPEQTTLLLDRLEDPDWFGTPYPIPTHPVNSKYFDPHYKRKEGPNWQGPVWIISNHQLVEEGLVRQAKRFFDSSSTVYDPELGMRCMKIANNIVRKTEELLAINKEVWELYDPKTGQGRRVKHFLWSNLGLHFDNFKDLKRKMGIEESWLK